MPRCHVHHPPRPQPSIDASPSHLERARAPSPPASSQPHARHPAPGPRVCIILTHSFGLLRGVHTAGYEHDASPPPTPSPMHIPCLACDATVRDEAPSLPSPPLPSRPTRSTNHPPQSLCGVMHPLASSTLALATPPCPIVHPSQELKVHLLCPPPQATTAPPAHESSSTERP